MGYHALFQGICLTQGSKLCLLHCRQILTTEPPGAPNNKLHYIWEKIRSVSDAGPLSSRLEALLSTGLCEVSGVFWVTSFISWGADVFTFKVIGLDHLKHPCTTFVPQRAKSSEKEDEWFKFSLQLVLRWSPKAYRSGVVFYESVNLKKKNHWRKGKNYLRKATKSLSHVVAPGFGVSSRI